MKNLFENKSIIVPFTEISFLQKSIVRTNTGDILNITIILKSSAWNFKEIFWDKTISLTGEEAEKFITAWKNYIEELEN